MASCSRSWHEKCQLLAKSSTLSVSPSSFLTTAQPSLSPSQHLCLSLSLSLSLCLSVSVCILFNLAGWDEWQKMPPHVRWLYLLCVIKLKPFSYCTFQKKFKKKKQCSPPHMQWEGRRERAKEWEIYRGEGGGTTTKTKTAVGATQRAMNAALSCGCGH